MDEWNMLVEAYRGTKICVSTEEWGVVDFNPEIVNNIVCKDPLTYDEYLEIVRNTAGNYRSGFQQLLYTCPLSFRGQIEKINARKICFQRIFIEGMYFDGVCFDGKEDHVWMDRAGFEHLSVGDCVSFFAKPYRYIKTSNGKMLDFGLRNPQGIRKVPHYELPTDAELMAQTLQMIKCEACYLYDNCDHVYCMLR